MLWLAWRRVRQLMLADEDVRQPLKFKHAHGVWRRQEHATHGPLTGMPPIEVWIEAIANRPERT